MTTEEKLRFDLTLDELLRAKKATRAALAPALGVRPSTVRGLLRGHRGAGPTRETVTDVAQALRLSDDERAGLLLAGGYVPGHIAEILADDLEFREVVLSLAEAPRSRLPEIARCVGRKARRRRVA